MRKLLFSTVALVAASLFLAPSTASATGFSDDFEYADQAAFEASWIDDTAGLTAGPYAPASLVSTGAHGGSKCAEILANATVCRRAKLTGDMTPTDANPVVWDFWLKVNAATSGRVLVQLVNSGGSAGIQLGTNNGSNLTDGFIVRDIGGVPTATTLMTGATRAANTWTNFKAVLGTRSLAIYQDGNLVFTPASTRTADFTTMAKVRLGAGYTTTVVGDVDDMNVYQAAAGVDDWSMF